MVHYIFYLFPQSTIPAAAPSTQAAVTNFSIPANSSLKDKGMGYLKQFRQQFDEGHFDDVLDTINMIDAVFAQKDSDTRNMLGRKQKIKL